MSISLEIPPTPLELQTCTISHKKFDTVTHLGQITSFDPFCGNLGVKWGQKGQKLVTLLKKSYKNRKFVQADEYRFIENSTLSLIFCILQFLRLFGASYESYRGKKC